MTSKFELAYMTAAIRTSSLPRLTADQAAGIERFMAKEGLVRHKTGSITDFEPGLGGTLNPDTESAAHKTRGKDIAHGYFSEDLREGIVISPNGFAGGAGIHETYPGFCDSFSRRVCQIMDIAEAYEEVKVREVILSCLAIITPPENRKLADYFSNGADILPPAFFESVFASKGNGGLYKPDLVQVTKMIDQRQKITATIEPLSTEDGRITKHIPDILMEAGNEPDQPLAVKEDRKHKYGERENLALLLVQATTLPDCQLRDYRNLDLLNEASILVDELLEPFKKELSKPVSVADMIDEITSVFGLSVVQIAEITEIPRPEIFRHIKGEAPSDPSAYQALHELATTVRREIRETLKPGLKSMLIEGKTLLGHLDNSYRDKEKILRIAGLIAEKLKKGEPKPIVRSLSEQRQAVMTIGKYG